LHREVRLKPFEGGDEIDRHFMLDISSGNRRGTRL
jgi:hypothetical protein